MRGRAAYFTGDRMQYGPATIIERCYETSGRWTAADGKLGYEHVGGNWVENVQIVMQVFRKKKSKKPFGRSRVKSPFLHFCCI